MFSKYDVYTTVQSLYCYPDSDVLKNKLNIMDRKRLHIHSEEAAEGKTFVAFIALVIRSQLLKKLDGLMAAEQMTLRNSKRKKRL